MPVLLLHTWPFHRHAAYLAQVFDHVFLDLGLDHPQHRRLLGRRAARDPGARAVRQAAVLHRRLRSRRALPARAPTLFRRSLTAGARGLVAAGDATAADAVYVAGLVARDNARRAYGL